MWPRDIGMRSLANLLNCCWKFLFGTGGRLSIFPRSSFRLCVSIFWGGSCEEEGDLPAVLIWKGPVSGAD